MIDSLHDVIHRRALCRDAKRIGLEDKTRLFLCQTATLYVIRIISQVNLSAVIYAPFQPGTLFFTQTAQQRRNFSDTFPWRLNVSRDVPRLARQESTFYLSFCTVITNGTLTDLIFLGKLSNRYIFHKSTCIAVIGK